MYSLSIVDHELSAAGAIELLNADLASGRRAPPDRERILFHLSRYGRIAAIAALLGRGDVEVFHDRLQQSGEHRRLLLQERQQQQRPFTGFSCAGHLAPLCDALAAGSETAARDITSLSSTQWIKGEEYEDDFHHAVLLGLLVAEPETPPTRAAMSLAALARICGDAETARVRVCRALFARDAGSFDVAIRDLLAEHGAWYRARAEDPRAKEAWFATNRAVCIEGLALLRLAETRGLTLEQEYPFCPGLARLPPSRRASGA